MSEKDVKMKKEEEGWILFFEHKGQRYYLYRMYKIGRVKFSKTHFLLFKDIFEANDALKKVEKCIKIIPLPIPDLTGRIQFKAAQVSVRPKDDLTNKT